LLLSIEKGSFPAAASGWRVSEWVQRRAVGGRKENRPSELKEEEEEEEEGEIEKEKRAEIVLIAGARESETGSQSSRPLSLPVGRSDGRRCSC
jgi:hypothetical protein